MRATLTGRVDIELTNADGSVALSTHGHNFITDLGEAHLADQLSDAGNAAIGWMAIGDSSGQEKADTTLASETARVPLDSTTQGTSGDDNDVIYVATFGAGVGTGTVSEMGLLNAVSSGVLFNYSDTFDAFTKGAGQVATVTLTLTLGTG